MRSFRYSIIFSLSLCISAEAQAPLSSGDIDDFFKDAFSDIDDFAKKADKEITDFLQKANQEMADFLGRPWEEVVTIPKKEPEPEPKPVPIIIDDNENRPEPKPRPVTIDTVITPPKPVPQPKPVSPIKEIPVPKPEPPMRFTYYGTPMEVRGSKLASFTIPGNNFADGWRRLITSEASNFAADCLKLREKYQLCDWAFFDIVQQASKKVTGDKKNETAMLTAYVLLQCGYKVRLARDANNRLHVYFACNGYVIGRGGTCVDGHTYYALTEPSSEYIWFCDFAYPKEKVMTMAINRPMKLAYSPAATRTITAIYNPSLQVTVTPNKNLIDFYNNYPEATLDSSPYTRWAIYANVPASDEIVKGLYPKAKAAIAGLSQREAANVLIHLAQTFPYGYDNEIWGGDRAFFPDETWHYPYSDCEDHAIHFSRLVRDLMGLDVALVYYPGHLAAAVAFTDPNIKGDYITYKGRRYTVCDPTYFYANIGETMPNMDNSSAILIETAR